jgi:serine-type D-Ala-D-Ala carboxypeptidase/endopeptidase (penicillin-binding protein 4)
MLKRFVLISFFLAWGLSADQVVAKDARSLASQLDRLAARGPLAKASVGIYVERASDRKPVYSRGPDRLLIPASNQKILTSLAALHRFGPTHRFATQIWSSQEPDVDGVVPELIVEGGGDPAMNSEDWWRLAADLRRDGLRGVRGDLRIDDSHFDPPGWHPSWGRVSARAYHAPIGALTANYGSFFVSISPQRTVGGAADVYIDPPVEYLRLSNRAKTGGPNARGRLRVDRIPGGEGREEEIVRVEGIARQGDDADVIPRSVLDPGLYAGSLLALQLEANDIFLDGGVRRAPRGKGDLVLILDRPGRSLSEIVQLCMKYSNNSIAETLVKNLGAYSGADVDASAAHQGSWVAGIRALREELSALGIELGEARIVDGSGLSIQNRVTPRIFVQALRAGREDFALGPEFIAALPIAERDGTLERRLDGGGGRIRAKTGLLGDAAVSSLSGYAERADGETLIFSILVNGHTGGSGEAMDAVDALARVLLEAPLPAAPAPLP